VLSSEEDSVTSLAATEYVTSQPPSYTAFAGINSSVKSQSNGTNEHLRVFTIRPDSSKPQGAVKQASQNSLFIPSQAPKKETYQRIVKLSPCRQDGSDLEDSAATRLGVTATGLADVGQIVFFDPTEPKSVTPIHRIVLGKGAEAADLDIRTTLDGDFRVLYCTEAEIFLVSVPAAAITDEKASASKISEPRLLFSRKGTSAGKPTFRGIRFLTANLIMVLQNLPGRTGSELVILQVDDDGAVVRLRKRMHSAMKSATGMDVTVLGDNQGDEKQFVIAVSGQNCSVEVLTLDFTTQKGLQTFRPVAIFKELHPWPITDIKFAPFRASALSGTQVLRLCSVSSGNTVVLHSFKLYPIIYPPKISHWVVNKPARRGGNSAVIIILLAIISLILAIIVQLALQLFGYSPVDEIISPQARYKMEQYVVNSFWLNPRMLPAKMLFPWEPLESISPNPADVMPPPMVADPDTEITSDDGHVVFREHNGEIVQDVHGDESIAAQHGTKWEDLSIKERELWKAKLKESGKYVGSQAETLLKGVFFGELAGVVGRAIVG
jgi:hypothetical protein